MSFLHSIPLYFLNAFIIPPARVFVFQNMEWLEGQLKLMATC